MTVSFATMMGRTSPTDTPIEPESERGNCQTTPTPTVDALTTQDDADREERIRHHKNCMEAAMQEYERSGCFASRGQADYHRIQFEAEIKARSPEYVAHIERVRGIL